MPITSPVEENAQFTISGMSRWNKSVSVAVSDLADFVACHESFFLQMIGKQQSAGKDQNIRSIKSDIAAGKHRIDEIDRLIAKLYEDNFAGKLSDERYSRMAAKYEKEQA